MSELEPVEPEEAVEYLFQSNAAPARDDESEAVEVAQPIEEYEAGEELKDVAVAEPVEEKQAAEAPPPVPPLSPKRKVQKPAAAKSSLSNKAIAPVKPFKHPVPASASAAVKPVEKYYYLTGAQLVTMVISLPLMSAAISMGSMYLGHVITEESVHSANVAVAQVARFDPRTFIASAPAIKPAAIVKPEKSAAAPSTPATATPPAPNLPSSPISQISAPAKPAEETCLATAALAVQAPVTKKDGAERYAAEVVPDTALDNVIPASATTQEQPATRAPAAAPRSASLPIETLAPVAGRSSSYLSPLDDTRYLVNVTARDEVETVVPMAPPAPSTRAVEVDMPAATFEAPDEPKHYAEVLTPPSEPASTPPPPVTVTVETKPLSVVPPASSASQAEPQDETMIGEILPRSAAEIARQQDDDERRANK